jgi:hypothetical protein
LTATEVQLCGACSTVTLRTTEALRPIASCTE